MYLAFELNENAELLWRIYFYAEKKFLMRIQLKTTKSNRQILEYEIAEDTEVSVVLLLSILTLKMTHTQSQLNNFDWKKSWKKNHFLFTVSFHSLIRLIFT